jgi:hypothetical protein
MSQVTFALVIVQNGLVIMLALILNPRARARRAKEAALTTSPSGTSTSDTRSTMDVDEEAAVESRYRAQQTHKGSVSSNADTLVGENDKEKSFSRFTTMEVDDESKYKSGLSTPVEISEKSEESITLGEDGLRR